MKGSCSEDHAGYAESAVAPTGNGDAKNRPFMGVEQRSIDRNDVAGALLLVSFRRSIAQSPGIASTATRKFSLSTKIKIIHYAPLREASVGMTASLSAPACRV